MATHKIDWHALDVIERIALRRRIIHPELSDVYVPGEGGNPIAFIIGEAPGAQELAKKRPFVGPSGQVLRQLMLIAGLVDEPFQRNCWVTNTVKFRPPMNRTPHWHEIKTFRDLLRAEWKAVGQPKIIIPVGAVALTAVFGLNHGMSILKVAGSVLHDADSTMYYWPMIHPSFGIRYPEVRKQMETHWQELGEWIDDHHG